MKRKRISDPELRYITRYHDKKSGYKAWWVRLQDYNSMTMLGQKMFYDHHYPQPYGKYAALVDAMLFRDKLAEKVGGYYIGKIEKEICPYYNTIKRRDNKSGHIGVHYTEYDHRKTYRKKDGTITKRIYRTKVWVASWVELDGTKKTKRFNANVHGNREAQRLAIQYRKAKEKQLRKEWNKETENQ